ncbi:MAG: ABC transporter permease [Candidatus Omnitrophica bacterium]|nr:ABC transporter permease [Candidatus Omnitrophota bacterium]
MAVMQEEGVLTIGPSRGWVSLRLQDLWEYRELLYFLIWRDLKVRYKQTAIGVAWAVLQPLLAMLIFSVFFGRLAGLPSDGIPYPVFAYCALLPWQFFAHALNESANSLVANQRLVTKVYFPRLIIPLAAVLSGLVDTAIAFILLLAMMAVFHIWPTPAVLLLPVFVVMAIAVALAIGLWFSALNVQYRDVRYIIPFLTQFWLFATPVVYSSSLVPSQWRWLLGLNPMAGVVEGFRFALLGRSVQGLEGLLAVSAVMSLVLLVTGLYYFRRMESTFADVI